MSTHIAEGKISDSLVMPNQTRGIFLCRHVLGRMALYKRTGFKMTRRKWLCLDCKIDTGKISEHYFLKTEVWLEATDSIFGMLCIGCVEKRLGRTLTKKDFTNCYLNDPKHGTKSLRLLQRLHHE